MGRRLGQQAGAGRGARGGSAPREGAGRARSAPEPVRELYTGAFPTSDFRPGDRVRIRGILPLAPSPYYPPGQGVGTVKEGAAGRGIVIVEFDGSPPGGFLIPDACLELVEAAPDVPLTPPTPLRRRTRRDEGGAPSGPGTPGEGGALVDRGDGTAHRAPTPGA